jgi:choline dehydrogenase-like flavoprotein
MAFEQTSFSIDLIGRFVCNTSAAGSSITNKDGRFHHIGNAFVAGPALFPRIGSANPSLTALALARHTARVIVDSL